MIQRRIVETCLRVGRPEIVATHMQESMIENSMPTRAEIPDVASAVFEQADAIMLSGETTTGKYPVQCAETFDRIARRVERDAPTAKTGRIGHHQRPPKLGQERSDLGRRNPRRWHRHPHHSRPWATPRCLDAPTSLTNLPRLRKLGRSGLASAAFRRDAVGRQIPPRRAREDRPERVDDFA